MEERKVFGPPEMDEVPTPEVVKKVPNPTKTKRRPKVPSSRFLEVYNRASSPSEAAAELGMDVATMNVRASILRKQGKLNKQFQRGRKKVSVDKGDNNEQESNTEGEDRNQAG